MTKTALPQLIAEAEAAVAGVKDADLKKVAFQTVLAHLLEDQGHSGPPPANPGKQAPPSAARPARRALATKSTGVMGRLRELVTEDFFKQPKTVGNVVDALRERACHVRDSDLTRQIAQLVGDKILRRKKEPIGHKDRAVWAYSNW